MEDYSPGGRGRGRHRQCEMDSYGAEERMGSWEGARSVQYQIGLGRAGRDVGWTVEVNDYLSLPPRYTHTFCNPFPTYERGNNDFLRNDLTEKLIGVVL